ncbi:MAG: Gfo/Idh/MocA family oxidoreductase [Phycisphaerae bacterium]|nr:Gfo/Idh/MocA family oxidoreductase [Phycisphaerae bacterium]
MIRVALVGAGFVGRNHFNQYQLLGDRARLVAICDADPARRAGDWTNIGGNLADATGRVQDLGDIRPYARWEDVVAAGDVDMLDITLPTFLHPDIATAALAAGKHVLCEKPMALTVEGCDRMLAAQKDSSALLMVAQCVRFWPEYVWLKQAHTENRYGKLKSLSLRRNAGTPSHSAGAWMLDPTKSGGALLDLHVHDADYALYLLGKPKSVCAQGHIRNGSPDRVHALWHYNTETCVYVEGCWDFPSGFSFNMGFTAVFEKAAAIWDMATGKPLCVMHNDGKTETPKVPEADGFFAEIEYFLSCIAAGTPPTTSTPQDSRDAIAIALAELESIRTGKPVPIR